MRTIHEIAKDLYDIERWLFECPFENNEPFVDVMEPKLASLRAEFVEAAKATKDKELIASTEMAEAGEYGDVEPMDFWAQMHEWKVTPSK